jgi:hypothetical protein
MEEANTDPMRKDRKELALSNLFIAIPMFLVCVNILLPIWCFVLLPWAVASLAWSYLLAPVRGYFWRQGMGVWNSVWASVCSMVGRPVHIRSSRDDFMEMTHLMMSKRSVAPKQGW